MPDKLNLDISIIGLGLIGGSIAKTLKKTDSSFTIKAYDLPEVICQALEEKVIDQKLDTIEESLSSDIIFLSLPVDLSLEVFSKLAPKLKKNTVMTDTCGVKGVFQQAWQSINSAGIYIGGHPMTGKEKGGFNNSDPFLFENSVYIISDVNPESEAKNNFLSLIRLLGARVINLDPFIHDKVVANVSHLPQLLSVALVNNASKNSTKRSNLDFAAGGFRDMTRIASSDFNIWAPVLKHNKQEILSALESMQSELEALKNLLLSDKVDEIKDEFTQARISRDVIPKDTKGFLSPLFHISVYVKDQPGVMSEISTALYGAMINIKDIELLKMREGTGGTFRFAFDSEEDAIKSKDILLALGFEVH